MKNKFTTIALAISLISSSAAIAEESKKADNFAQHKAEIVANINKEKAVLDQMIACVNGAAATGDIEKCRSQKASSMQAAKQEKIAQHQERLAQRKADLQGKIQKLDEKSSKMVEKAATPKQ